MKKIHINKGFKTSLQSHLYKTETNMVIEGKALVVLENKDGGLDYVEYQVGEGWCVPPNKKHRIIAEEDFTLIEVSTPHLDDVIRHEDDSNRPNGKIITEHHE